MSTQDSATLATQPKVRWGLMTALLCAVAGCQNERLQSALNPAGPAAESIANLWWVMLAVLGCYTLAVFVLTAIAVLRSKTTGTQTSPWTEGKRFIVVGGAILPTIILVPTLTYTVYTTAALRMKHTDMTIRVVGHRWWWEVHYPDHSIEIANELVIAAGEPVQLELLSADVIHSFWVPQLHGKMDLIPGRTNRFWIQADRAGLYRGQCAEYCGTQHALMGFVVKALEPNDFAAWLAAKSGLRAASAWASPAESSGQQLFRLHGCEACHTLDGTRAQGSVGPDLRYLRERQSLAAGTIVNSRHNLLQWLADPQSVKPGANMPATQAPADELQTLVDYLLNLQSEDGPMRGKRE